MATLYGSGRVLKDAWPTAGWSQEIWKDGIGNIDEQANGLGKFGSEISYPYANSVKNRQLFFYGFQQGRQFFYDIRMLLCYVRFL